LLPAAISEADARTRGLDRGLSPALKMTATGREEARVRASRAGRALVIGGSMGGLFTGLLMRRQGWDVRIFERVGGELAGRGAGIVTHPVLHDALRRAGVEDLDDLGVPLAALRAVVLEQSFWIGLAAGIVAAFAIFWGSLLSVILIGIPFLILATVSVALIWLWAVVRSAAGLVWAAQGARCPRPDTLTF
jgi:hypothetical protein